MALRNRAARNEQRKLIAGFMNTLALAVLVGGLIAPGFTLRYNSGPPNFHFVPWTEAVWAVGALGLHILGHVALWETEE